MITPWMGQAESLNSPSSSPYILVNTSISQNASSDLIQLLSVLGNPCVRPLRLVSFTYINLDLSPVPRGRST